MAYQFLTQEDLYTQSFDTYINKSNDAHTEDVLERLEAQNISLIESKLSGRYDTDAIFNAQGSNRHNLIIKLLVSLVLYDFFKRNKARKIPSDAVKDRDFAIEVLESIKAGEETPKGLPKPIDESGNVSKRVISGNRKTKNFYI